MPFDLVFGHHQDGLSLMATNESPDDGIRLINSSDYSKFIDCRVDNNFADRFVSKLREHV